MPETDEKNTRASSRHLDEDCHKLSPDSIESKLMQWMQWRLVESYAFCAIRGAWMFRERFAPVNTAAHHGQN